MSLVRLNSKEKKQFLAQLKEQYGYTEGLEQDILVNKNKGRYYLINPDVLEFSLEEYRVETIGLYFATVVASNDLRLTIEGSQMVGPCATKNVFEISVSEKKQWVRGEDIEIDSEQTGWLILRCENDYLGCGKVVHKEGETSLHNYIPKARYVRSAIE